MTRYERDSMLADAASVKPTKACPECAERPYITEPPNQVKKEEPKAGTSGLLDRKSATLNQFIIEQQRWTSNRNSRIPIVSIGEPGFVHCPWCDCFHVHGGLDKVVQPVIEKGDHANGNE
jgi:hypothetical protein